MRFFLILFSALMINSATHAASPSYDCAKASSGAEHLICADDDLAALDVQLANRFAAAVDAIRSLDTGADDALKTLRAEQRGWIRGRDDCWTSENERACIAEAYVIRDATLAALWMLSPVERTVFWTCSSPADEIVTLFFGTARPAVRIETGDRITIATQTPAASGSRYDGTFGEWIWIKGDIAHYQAPDPEGIRKSCTLRETR